MPGRAFLLALMLFCFSCSRAGEQKAPEARAPEARAPEARAPEARAPEARAPEAQAQPTAQAPPSATGRNAAPHLDPVVVVELFTSEGCSSCPPADRALSKLVAWAKSEKLPVLTLSFHVDYWNYLGYRDPFSDAAYSARQRWYARQRFDGRVYTPQMVVQGRVGFVGSDLEHAKQTIGEFLKQRPEVAVRLTLRDPGPGAKGYSIRYDVEGAKPDARLSLALVQSAASSDVSAGENAGKTLSHVSVVRDLASASVGSGRGKWTARLRTPRTGQQPSAAFAIVAIVQDAETASVLGANRLEL